MFCCSLASLICSGFLCFGAFLCMLWFFVRLSYVVGDVVFVESECKIFVIWLDLG